MQNDVDQEMASFTSANDNTPVYLVRRNICGFHGVKGLENETVVWWAIGDKTYIDQVKGKVDELARSHNAWLTQQKQLQFFEGQGQPTPANAQISQPQGQRTPATAGAGGR